MISQMKVEELKSFLRARGLRVTGRKQELIARVFVACENDVPVVKTAEEVQKEIVTEYKAKLSFADQCIPDPFQLAEGWLTENEGLKFWPTTLYPDIFNFLSFNPSELKSQDLNDYKTSKGYSYYATGWLKPLLYHPISSSSKYCLIKSTCRPSQKISDVPHKLWVCLKKESGQIQCSHCTCMAGLSQVCNHVAAALFRIEAAVRMGLNNPSCTSKPNAWLPNNKEVQPLKLKDIKLKRADFGTRGKKKSELNSSPKKRFDALGEEESNLTLDDIASALTTVCDRSQSMVFSAVNRVGQNATAQAIIEEELYTFDKFLMESESSEEFLMKMEYFPSNRTKIEIETRGQSDNPLWFSVRKHVISASKAHSVKTKMQTQSKSCNSDEAAVDFEAIFKSISGSKYVNPELPALKYGRAMEAEAVNAFITEYKKTHKGVTVNECGIFLCKDVPFVGGSPDRILDCLCCGKSCLEVKCPYSIRDKSPMDADVTLPYLNKDANVTSLKANHKYYTQCQVQMAASEIHTCHFYVWTPNGAFTQMLSFERDLWMGLKEVFSEFYLKFYVPSLFKE